LWLQGHYCQKGEVESQNGPTRLPLLAGGQIPTKIRAISFCQLNQSQLEKALFPIGHLQKPEVEKSAKKLDLINCR